MIRMNTMPYRSIVGTSCSVIVKNDRVSILQQAKLPIEFCDSLGAKKQILRLSKSKDILHRSSRIIWPSFAELRSCVQKALNSPIHLTDFKLLEQKWFNFHAVAIVVGACILFPSSAYSVDALKTCTCLLRECRLELARCIADPLCAANVACLQTCNNRPDETECQVKCGDLFENSVVDQFNDCAVSKKGCVPQKSDDGRFPVPPPSVLVQNFRTTDFTGKWFITSGLNPSFDTFDCQLHEFFATPGKLQGNISWRVNTPDGGFITRKTVQNFVQDPKQPGVLYNHGNEFLHYKDDWYILSSKIDNQPDDYIFIYYKGSNDAWDGYGGAVVYTRSRTLPSSIVPALKDAAKRVGLNFENFKATDNTCNPEPPLLARLEKSLEKGEQAIIKEAAELEEQVEKKVESVEMQLLGRLGKGIQEFQKGEKRFIQELSEDEKAFLSSLQMEAEDIEKLFGKALAVRKFR